MAIAFPVGARGTDLVPLVPRYAGNDRAPEDKRVTVWFRPVGFDESEELKARGQAASESGDDGENEALLDETLDRIGLLTLGKPGEGQSTRKPEDIRDTIKKHPRLALEVAMGIASSDVSEVDEVFFGWLSTGDGEG